MNRMQYPIGGVSGVFIRTTTLVEHQITGAVGLIIIFPHKKKRWWGIIRGIPREASRHDMALVGIFQCLSYNIGDVNQQHFETLGFGVERQAGGRLERNISLLECGSQAKRGVPAR